MSKLQGEILTLPKMNGSVSSPSTLGGNIGAKTINIGEDGATFIPSVSSDGVISWTNNQDLPNPEPVNIKGVKGEQGIQGAAGADGKDGTSVTVKSVSESTADGGSNVVTFSDGKTLTVKNGTKGSDGKDGANGKDGADGESGVYILSKGETLADAPTNADVVIDQYGEATPAVVSINGIKPDANGNINLPIYNGEVASV